MPTHLQPLNDDVERNIHVYDRIDVINLGKSLCLRRRAWEAVQHPVVVRHSSERGKHNFRDCLHTGISYMWIARITCAASVFLSTVIQAAAGSGI